MSATERQYIAGLRPSRIREAQAGAPARATFDLIDPRWIVRPLAAQ